MLINITLLVYIIKKNILYTLAIDFYPMQIAFDVLKDVT